MKKSKPPKAAKREDGVDLISSMPDDILVSILSHLPHTEEVIRSSILSRRWRYFWTSIPSLDIYCFRGSTDQQNFKKSKFKEFVYWVLANKSVNLDRFHLGCANYYTMSTVGRWIHVAVTRNVRQLELTFRPKEDSEDVEMPNCLVTCGSLEVLTLNMLGHRLRLPNSMGFRALRVLKLSRVDLLGDDGLVKGFLERCPLLEKLSLISCIMNELDLLCISCPKLEMLRIENDNDECMCDCIMISCPKLVDLDLRGHIAYNFFFDCPDSLKEAAIEPKLMNNTISVVLFPGISRVEYLSIHLHLFILCLDGECDPSLPNLRNLVLNTTMDAFTMDSFKRVLKYYPKLVSLELIIQQDFHGKYACLDKDETMRISTPDMKKVAFFEFNGEKPKLLIDWRGDKLVMFFTWG
ncbi:unnamed protein product [Lactuca saligna]|uniref:F-box domain-containing protein n=1 Tax=Lactuca saligna TaxID=75948 RepID=A0AA35Z3J5_LACSI|nr:unnamed protein product [Lactuca saligna]